MKLDDAITLGKDKVRNSYVSHQINELDDKVFEILGYTEVDYYDTEENYSIHNQYPAFHIFQSLLKIHFKTLN